VICSAGDINSAIGIDSTELQNVVVYLVELYILLYLTSAPVCDIYLRNGPRFKSIIDWSCALFNLKVEVARISILLLGASDDVHQEAKQRWKNSCLLLLKDKAERNLL
jgi:hypothetical protein